MNPEMNIVVYETPVGPTTENLFDDKFWNGLDGVCNALDNIKARNYSDSKHYPDYPYTVRQVCFLG